MRKVFNPDRALWSIVLLLLFYTFVKMIYSGDIKNFIHPNMIKYSIFGAIAIGIMLINNFLNTLSEAEEVKVRYGYILFLIPVIIYMIVKPTGLTESAAINRGVNLYFYKSLMAEEGKGGHHHHHHHHEDQHSHNHGDGEIIIENGEVIVNNENFFTSFKEFYKNTEEYKERPVRIKGFVIKEKGKSESFILSRMVVSCCAADTEVIGIRSIYKDTPLIANGQWLEVKGKLQFEGVEQGPIIIVESLNPIDKPEESYIYRD
jgi:putative membrane protein